MSKVDFYKEQIKKLLPKGKLWEAAPGTYLDKFLEGFAVELSRIDDRAQKLLEEADPRTTLELLDEWEAMTGLPDDCTGAEVTINDRRSAVLAKLTFNQSTNKQFYVDLANSLGYEIDLDDVITYNPFRVGDRVGERLNGMAWAHAFGLVLGENTTRLFRVEESVVGERLVEFGDATLECLIERYKPAHSSVLFNYE